MLKFHLNCFFDRKLLSQKKKNPPCLVFLNSLYLLFCISKTTLEMEIKPYSYLSSGMSLSHYWICFSLDYFFSLSVHKSFLLAYTVPHCSRVDKRTTLQSTVSGASLQHESFASCEIKNQATCVDISSDFAYQLTINSSLLQYSEALNHQSFLCSQ